MSSVLESVMPSTDDILAATAHELRLPLGHIKGFVTSLRRTDVEWDDETRKEFIAEIDLETDRLAEVVETLCTPWSAAERGCTPWSAAERGSTPWSAAERGSTPWSAAERGLATHTSDGRNKADANRRFTHPTTVVQGALHRIRGLLDGRPMRLDVSPCLLSIRMEASQMERVLANLIQNAVKYSPAGTTISVSAHMTNNAELEFTVEDEGPGIPAEYRERIFDPFFRMRTAQQSELSGHGLGLAICKSIVLAHGGRIQIRDRPGGGACFSVFLPAQAPTHDSDSNYQPEGRCDGTATDATIYSHRGRRGADSQAPVQQTSEPVGSPSSPRRKVRRR